MDDAALTIKVCEVLGSLPGWQWSETTPYVASKVAVFYGAILAEPDRAVGVRVYGISDVGAIKQRRVQIRTRGRPRDLRGADDLATIHAAVLVGAGRLPGISGIKHISMAPLGADSSGRQERTDNYIITLDNAEAFTS
ncbi:MAG: minor capsid protein [Hyphomicrobium sp.]|jgi:hypothetical protein